MAMTREQELEDRIRQLEAEVRKLSEENVELKLELQKWENSPPCQC
jgi:phage shock protein A